MAETVTMPKLGFDMAEGTLVRWVIAEGQPVSRGSVLAEIETDKATVEVESSFDGIVAKHLVEQGSVVPVNTPIAIVAQPGEAVEAGKEDAAEKPEGEKKEAAQPANEKPQPPEEEQTSAPSTPATSSGRLKASPLARRIASEKGIELAQVQGSGPGGRIIKKDVESWRLPPTQPQAAPQPAALSGETVPLTRLRAAIARRMVEATQNVPHFYVTHEYKMDALLALRKQMNAYLPEGEKLSVNDFIVRAVALALRQFPNLNASFTGEAVQRHAVVNIGVAVAVEGGLLTIVCKEADTKSLRQISAQVSSMVERARQGKVRPEDIEGSTFSISNLGMFDVENFAAIINPPEAAILAVGSAREIPVVVDGALQVGWRMKVTVSVDHRVSDGAEAAQFMQALATYFEEPLRLLV